MTLKLLRPISRVSRKRSVKRMRVFWPTLTDSSPEYFVPNIWWIWDIKLMRRIPLKIAVSFLFLYLTPNYAFCILKIRNILNEYFYSNTIEMMHCIDMQYYIDWWMSFYVLIVTFCAKIVRIFLCWFVFDFSWFVLICFCLYYDINIFWLIMRFKIYISY